MKTNNIDGFSILAIVMVIVVTGLIGGVGYYVYKQQNSVTPESVTQQVTKDSPTANSEGAYESVNTTYSSKDGTVKITVTHPKKWEVTNTKDEYDRETQVIHIKSDKGNYLHLFEPGGLGGDCQSNNTSYTLVKKIPTQTEGLYFTEYMTESQQFKNSYLSLQTPAIGSEYATNKEEHKNLKEGESNTDVCNISGYSMLSSSKSSYGYVSITKQPKVSLSSEVSYEELSGDPQFIEMLKSLKAEVN